MYDNSYCSPALKLSAFMGSFAGRFASCKGYKMTRGIFMWMKKLRQRKLQSVLIFVIVFVCSILMTSSMVIMTSLHEPYQELIKECNSPEVKIYPMAMSEEELGQLKARFEALDSYEWADTVRYLYLTKSYM